MFSAELAGIGAALIVRFVHIELEHGSMREEFQRCRA
jgi:hypothetical protein